ncbi:hypothetical protein AJ87_15035 [Rhizobium yanglingense]|nr:hypothetical protein AJ87_15035 [Rhizobium yanglingense]
MIMEACGSAHYWVRELVKVGHAVTLIAPQYVRPFVKRQKNDAADAEAIDIAARQPEMRFVPPKTADQQARAVLFRGREGTVRQRTELVNALRAVLYEYGQVIPLGIGHVKRIEAIVEDAEIDMPELVGEECRQAESSYFKQSSRRFWPPHCANASWDALTMSADQLCILPAVCFFQRIPKNTGLLLARKSIFTRHVSGMGKPSRALASAGVPSPTLGPPSPTTKGTAIFLTLRIATPNEPITTPFFGKGCVIGNDRRRLATDEHTGSALLHR